MTLVETPRSKTSALALADLLAPLSVDEFLADYYTAKHLFVTGRDASHYGDLFSIADVDRWIEVHRDDPRELLLIVPPADSGAPAQRTSLRRTPVDQLYGSFAAGATIVLEGIQRGWPAVTELAARLGEELSARIEVNLYMTPPGRQGVRVHPDKQDVLVVQLEGAKDWFIHQEIDPIELDNLTYLPELRAPAQSLEDLAVVEERRLTAGDFLYLPRGLPHKAAAPDDQPSLHFAICVHPLHWVDFLKAAVEIVSTERPALARPLPPGFLSAREPAAMEETFRRVWQDFASEISFERTRDVMRAGQVRRSSFPGDGHFAQLLALDAIDGATTMRRRRGLSCRFEETAEGAALHFAGRSMQAPPAARRALEAIAAQESFQPRELPGLDPRSQVILVRRLVKMGLLRSTPDA